MQRSVQANRLEPLPLHRMHSNYWHVRHGSTTAQPEKSLWRSLLSLDAVESQTGNGAIYTRKSTVGYRKLWKQLHV